MEKQKSGKAKRDALLLSLISAAAAVLIIILISARSCSHAENVLIRVDGNVFWEGSVKKDDQIEVNGFDGGHNTVVIKDGEVCVTQADCPDKVCVKTGKVNAAGQTIVCLPHRVVVEIK